MVIFNTEYKSFYQRNPGANTIAYYPLTATDTVDDKSGNGKNLTNTGVTFGTVGNVSCATFNGSSYLNRSESLFTGNSTFTVNLWFRRTTDYSGGIHNIFTVGTAYGTNSFIIWANKDNGHLYVGGWTNDRDTGYTVPLNQWINIMYTHNAGTIKVYINSSLIYTGTVSYGIQAGYTGVGCGVGNGVPMRGNLSNVIVESTERTATDGSDYYNGTKGNYGY